MTLTPEILAEAIRRCPPPPNPFEEMARRAGGDLQAGDKLFVPLEWLSIFPTLTAFQNTPGVHFSEQLSDAYLLKASALPDWVPFSTLQAPSSKPHAARP